MAKCKYFLLNCYKAYSWCILQTKAKIKMFNNKTVVETMKLCRFPVLVGDYLSTDE